MSMEGRSNGNDILSGMASKVMRMMHIPIAASGEPRSGPRPSLAGASRGRVGLGMHGQAFIAYPTMGFPLVG